MSKAIIDLKYNVIYNNRGILYSIVSVHYGKHTTVAMRDIKFSSWLVNVTLEENETLEDMGYTIDKVATMLYSKGMKYNVGV